MIPTLLTFCLLTQGTSLPPYGATVSCGVVRKAPAEGQPLEVRAGPEETHYLWVEPSTVILWHLDARVALPPSALRPGVRIRCELRPTTNIVAVATVVTLGPLAMEAAVEEFVVATGACPAEHRGVLDGLGAPCFQLRQAASQRLRGRPEMLRALIWARHSGDREVRERAEGLLWALGWP